MHIVLLEAAIHKKINGMDVTNRSKRIIITQITFRKLLLSTKNAIIIRMMWQLSKCISLKELRMAQAKHLVQKPCRPSPIRPPPTSNRRPCWVIKDRSNWIIQLSLDMVMNFTLKSCFRYFKIITRYRLGLSSPDDEREDKNEHLPLARNVVPSSFLSHYKAEAPTHTYKHFRSADWIDHKNFIRINDIQVT